MAHDYPIARVLMAPEYRSMSPAHIESVLAEAFPGMAPEDAENFLAGFGRAFQNVGKTVAQRAPAIFSGAVKGATTGAALGPWGALGGALVGGTMGGIRQGGGPQRRPRPPVHAPPAAPAFAAAAPAGGAAPAAGASPASLQLIQLLSNPQTFQALLAGAFGGAGRPTVPVGRTAVPTSSILGALGTLANSVAGADPTSTAGAR